MNRIEQQHAVIAQMYGRDRDFEELLAAAQAIVRIMYKHVYGGSMPSKTPKQRRTMAAAAHNPAFAKKMGIPQKVAKEFNRADARKKKR